MADNVDIQPAGGTVFTLAADEVGGVLFQRFKLAVGADGAATDVGAGFGLAANALRVVFASDMPSAMKGRSVTWVDHSGSISSDGADQQLMAANASREGGFIINLSATDTLWIREGGATATLDQPSIPIPPGARFDFPVHGVPASEIRVNGAKSGHKFAAREW